MGLTPEQGCGMGGGGGFVLGVVIGTLITCGGLYYYTTKYTAKSARTSQVQMQFNAAPQQTAAMAPAPAGLPPGWTEASDPASGRTYYYHAPTGQSSWTPPVA